MLHAVGSGIHSVPPEHILSAWTVSCIRMELRSDFENGMVKARSDGFKYLAGPSVIGGVNDTVLARLSSNDFDCRCC